MAKQKKASARPKARTVIITHMVPLVKLGVDTVRGRDTVTFSPLEMWRNGQKGRAALTAMDNLAIGLVGYDTNLSKGNAKGKFELRLVGENILLAVGSRAAHKAAGKLKINAAMRRAQETFLGKVYVEA